MWLVEIHPRVDLYLEDFKGEKVVLDLRASIIRLFFTTNGLPSEGELIDCDNNFFWWIIHNHSLLLRQVERQVGKQGVLITEVSHIIDSEIRSDAEIQRQIANFRK